jgi:hypothetical protein
LYELNVKALTTTESLAIVGASPIAVFAIGFLLSAEVLELPLLSLVGCVSAFSGSVVVTVGGVTVGFFIFGIFIGNCAGELAAPNAIAIVIDSARVTFNFIAPPNLRAKVRVRQFTLY